MVGTIVREELSYSNLDMSYWVDSMIVLGYILNDVKRFRRFVSNRVKKIRDYTKKKEWHYVHTDSNPADYTSRGITMADNEKVKRWLHGPLFLWEPEEDWNVPEVEEIPDDDPEIIPSTALKCNSIKIDG